MSEKWPVISHYSWQQAFEDGFLVELFKNRWPELSNGKPILATSHLFSEISLAGLREIWNEFVLWQQKIMPTLKEEDRMFVTMMNGEDIWLIDDGATYTMLYPSDY
jgi:hypothetical protein